LALPFAVLGDEVAGIAGEHRVFAWALPALAHFTTGPHSVHGRPWRYAALVASSTRRPMSTPNTNSVSYTEVAASGDFRIDDLFEGLAGVGARAREGTLT
jgi:hypothetical protein